jgi:hypothetical protein
MTKEKMLRLKSIKFQGPLYAGHEHKSRNRLELGVERKVKGISGMRLEDMQLLQYFELAGTAL